MEILNPYNIGYEIEKIRLVPQELQERAAQSSIITLQFWYNIQSDSEL
jgi:hypothetical protein